MLIISSDKTQPESPNNCLDYVIVTVTDSTESIKLEYDTSNVNSVLDASKLS